MGDKVTVMIGPGGSLDVYARKIIPVVEVVRTDIVQTALEQMVAKYETDSSPECKNFVRELNKILLNKGDYAFTNQEGDPVDISRPIETYKLVNDSRNGPRMSLFANNRKIVGDYL